MTVVGSVVVVVGSVVVVVSAVVVVVSSEVVSSVIDRIALQSTCLALGLSLAAEKLIAEISSPSLTFRANTTNLESENSLLQVERTGAYLRKPHLWGE